MFCIVLILVLQIIYCSAHCNCPGKVVLPLYAIIVIGIIIAILFFATVALAIYVYRLKQDSSTDRSIFGKPKLSISKYERQLSGNSNRMILRDSMNDDTAQLNSNENINDTDSNSTIADQVKIEAEPDRRPPKLAQKPKVPIFPHMPEEQINKICEAVLNSHRKKEFTSLSELDKIVSDAKEEKSKILDTSASTPELDTLEDPTPIPVPVKKLPIFDANSKESRLRDEMKAMFNQDEFKSILKSKNKQESNKDTIDSKDKTKCSDEIKSNDENRPKEEIETKDNFLPQDKRKLKNDKSEDTIKTRVNAENILPIESQNKTNGKPNQSEINSKRLNLEIMAKFNQGAVQKQNVTVKDSNSCDDTPEQEHFHVALDEICPPRLRDDFYDILPSPKPSDDTYDYPPSPKPSNELYDFPPSSKPSNEIYDFPPSPKPSNELYDFPPSPKPHNAVYDCISQSERRNLIVSDGNSTGYLFPLTNSSELFEGPQYSNAKSLLDKDVLCKQLEEK